MTTDNIGNTGEQLPIRDHFESDIIVVGLGYAGIAAVRAARETGADVIAMDPRDYADIRLGGRNFEHVNSRFLKMCGVPEADVGAILDTWPDRDTEEEPFASIRLWLEGSGDAFEWFTNVLSPKEREKIRRYEYKKSDPGELPPPPVEGHQAVITAARFPETAEDGGITLSDCAIANLYCAEEQGASLFFELSPLHWLSSGDHVYGVIAKKKDGTLYSFTARQGVILCAELSAEETLKQTSLLSVPGRKTVSKGSFFAGSIHRGETDDDIGIGMAVTLGRAYGLAAAEGSSGLF